MTLHVLDPGLYSIVVDLGRPRSRSLGVPVGGAADRAAFLLGNALVGNPPEAAALEITLVGPTLRADSDVACVVYGAPFELSRSRQSPKVGTTFTLTEGEELKIGSTFWGVRAYLCVRGGIHQDVILDSRSALEPVKRGDVLRCPPGRMQGRFVRVPGREERWREGWSSRRVRLRVLSGPQYSWFPEPVRDRITSFAVTPASNRMGIRLQGDPLPVPAREMVSEPVCPGSVQVTRDGQCIILGVDGQTIGGYPKVAQVIGTDLDELAQLRPGEGVTFEWVSLEQAETAYREKEKNLRAWLTRLRTAEVFVP